MNKHKKRLLFSLLFLGLVLILTGCGQQAGQAEPITAQSEGLWDGVILYSFSRMIIWISDLFGGSYGAGIIVFTLIIRILLIPVSLYQTKSTRKMSELNPEIQALREKYDTSDKEEMEQFNEAQARLYEEKGVNPYASCLPLLIQTPLLIALYQAISRTPVISQSEFLWVNLGEPDPYYILPILAAILAFANSKLMTMTQDSSQPGMGAMTYVMPIMIFVISFRLASALSLYFVVSNAFMVVQTLVFNNPFQLRREKEEQERLALEAEANRKRAIKKAKKTGRSVRK